MNPALLEVSAYHDMNATGYFAIRCNGKQGLHRMAELPNVLSGRVLEGETFVSQAVFRSPRNRRAVNLLRIGLQFIDCDLHRSEFADCSPEHAARTLLRFCDDEGIARPNLVNYSGRGIHLKWPFVEPIPAAATARWSANQKALAAKLAPFGADRGALDATRMLRCVSTINPKSGHEVRTLWADGGAWDFDLLANELLPWTRDEVKAWKQAQIEKRARKAISKARPAQSSNLWPVRDLWCCRLEDLRTLADLRGWQQNGVPHGHRNDFLFVGAIGISWAFGKQHLQAEVAEFARQLCPSMTAADVHSSVSSILSRAQSETQYCLRTSTIINLLNISPAEQPKLRTLASYDLRHERKQERDRMMHRKHSDRATFLATAQQRRELAESLRSQGLSRISIAERMGITVNAVAKLLRPR